MLKTTQEKAETLDLCQKRQWLSMVRETFYFKFHNKLVVRQEGCFSFFGEIHFYDAAPVSWLNAKIPQ